jgi:hypothetical protein
MRVRLGFSKGKSFIAHLICWLTGKDISHSFFLVNDGKAEWAYEAVPGGFRRVSWTKYQRDNSVKSLVDMTWPHERVKDILDAMLGMGYPLFSFFATAVVQFLWRANRTRPKGLYRSGVDCVTSVCRVLRQVGYDITEPLGPGQLHDMLMDIVRKRE